MWYCLALCRESLAANLVHEISKFELKGTKICYQRHHLYLSGNLSILNMLLAKRTSKKSLNNAFERHVVQDAEENLQRMDLHSLAAAHGHKRTLRRLMTMQEYGKIEKPSRSESLSLTEALAEMSGIV